MTATGASQAQTGGFIEHVAKGTGSAVGTSVAAGDIRLAVLKAIDVKDIAEEARGAGGR